MGAMCFEYKINYFVLDKQELIFTFRHIVCLTIYREILI